MFSAADGIMASAMIEESGWSRQMRADEARSVATAANSGGREIADQRIPLIRQQTGFRAVAHRNNTVASVYIYTENQLRTPKTRGNHLNCFFNDSPPLT